LRGPKGAASSNSAREQHPQRCLLAISHRKAPGMTLV
jgi:hypothetical protein